MSNCFVQESSCVDRGRTMKILIGSCGGLTGSYLSRRFKEITGVYVVGADLSSENATKFFVDEFHLLPPANSFNYIDKLIELLITSEIDAYIPTHSKEIKKVSQFEEKILSSWGGKLLVSPYRSYEQLDNKQIANANLKRLGIPVPNMYKNEEIPANFPVFVKPNVGSGSSDSYIVFTKQEYVDKIQQHKDCTAYEFIDGKEFTVDCMFDDKGELIAFNQRERVKNMGGAVIITRNDYSFDIKPYLDKIAAEYCIKGCANFQYILKDNIPYFIDVNLRYASGGLPLTVESGINVPQLMLDIWNGKDKFNINSCPKPGKIMYRYFCELYEG